MIWEIGNGDPVRRLSVFDRLDRKPDSGASRTLIAVANGGYGLVTGSSTSYHLEITERGREIVNPSSERAGLRAAHEALFSNAIFSAFVSRYQDKPFPHNEVATDYLKSSHGLTEADAKTCLEVFRDNVRDFGLLIEESGRLNIVSSETALAAAGGEPLANDEVAVSSQPPIEAIMPNPAMTFAPTPGRAQPQMHFNIQIHLPESASAETYEDIFRNIAVYLLGRDEE